MPNQLKIKEKYEAFLEKAKKDERIIGALLGGGRGKGIYTERSDYDVILITTDEGLEGVKGEYYKADYIEFLPHSISEFRDYAKIGTRTQYDKYTFTHVQALFDKTDGEIQKIINEKGALHADEALKMAQDSLGGYLNSLHRSLKNMRDGNTLAGQLDAAETVPRILTFVFAIENRVRPFNKFLAWELEHYKLEKLPLTNFDFLEKIRVITQTGNIGVQKEMLEIMRKLAIENGYGNVVEKWNGYYFG